MKKLSPFFLPLVALTALTLLVPAFTLPMLHAFTLHWDEKEYFDLAYQDMGVPLRQPDFRGVQRDWIPVSAGFSPAS